MTQPKRPGPLGGGVAALVPISVALAATLAPVTARAEMGELGLTTLEHAAELVRVRELKLKRQVETVRWPRSKIRAAALERPDPLHPGPELAQDLPLYQRLGLIPRGDAGSEVIEQAVWPLLPATYLPTPEEGTVALAREVPFRRVTKAHQVAVALALILQRYDPFTPELDGDHLLAMQSFVLGDALLSALSISTSSLPPDLEDRQEWAHEQVAALLTEPGADRRDGFVARLVRARLFAGISAMVQVRSTTPWGGVDELYLRGLPCSTAQLLHPPKLIERFEVRAVEGGPLAAFSERGSPKVGTLGELRTRLWLEEWLEPAHATRAASGWSGDHYALYAATAESPSTLVLLTTFDILNDPADREAQDYAGAIELALSQRFGSELRPLTDLPGQANGWVDGSEQALLVERREDQVLYIEGCPPDQLLAVRDQVWEEWRVARPVLGALIDPDAGPTTLIASPPPIPPWYRRTPGVVALVLWLLVLLPLGSYLGSRATRASLNPVKIYLYGLIATLGVIALGWAIGL